MNGPSGDFGPSHSGLDLGVGHTHGFAHGVHDLHFGTAHGAGQVTFDAIVVGYDFGNSESHAPHIDTSIGGHANFSAPAGNMEGNGPSFDVPIDSRRTNYGILVVGMGACDWETKARAILVKLGLAECFNLQPPNPLVSPARPYDIILPTNFKNPALKVVNPVMPKSYYEGATGTTTLWRTNWQVGARSFVAQWRGKPATRKVGVRTYLEVEVVDWFLKEKARYEIRLVVRAIGGNDPGELMEHLKAAREFCKAMLTELKASPPSSDVRA